MSLTREQIAEGERLFAAAREATSPYSERDAVGWFAVHGPALLAAARERDEARETNQRLNRRLQEAEAALGDLTKHPSVNQSRTGRTSFAVMSLAVTQANERADALAERVAGLEKERRLHIDLLEDAWYQWSLVIEGHDDSQLCAPRHDMCLSTLEEIRVALFDAGRLVKYAARPEMDWWVRANLLGLGAGASRTEASE